MASRAEKRYGADDDDDSPTEQTIYGKQRKPEVWKGLADEAAKQKDKVKAGEVFEVEHRGEKQKYKYGKDFGDLIAVPSK